MFTAGYIRSLLAAVALTVLSAGPAAAVTFGFASSPTAFVVDYEDFSWSGSKGNSSLIRGSGQRALPRGAPVAPLGYAYSNVNADITMSSKTLFSLDSVDIYGDSKLLGGKNAALTVTGYRDGVLVYTVVSGLLDSLPRGVFSTLSLLFKDVDQVIFSTGKKQNLLLTNVQYQLAAPPQVVPLPAGITLLVGGLGMLAALGLQRRQSKRAATRS